MSRRTGPILVAVDGSGAADAALDAARLLAARLASDVEVVTVSEPLPRYGPLVPAAELETAMDDRLQQAVRKQVSRSSARDAEWPVQVLHGSSAAMIARHARQRDARMIVLGRGPRDLRHRVLGGTLALRLAQLTDVPILCVATPFRELPRRALVALDFSPRSITAARSAMALLSDVGTVFLAHVVPRFERTMGVPEEWEHSFAAGLDAAYAEAERQIAPPATAAVETLSLKGEPADELLAAAGQIDADLIVCGTHGQGFIQRMLLGSVATKLLRAASCSVLLMPNVAAAERAEAAQVPRPAGGQRVDQTAWVETLRRFTEHNAGRRAILEIDDPSIGAQAQVVAYPFRGAAFDTRERQVELMFGEEGSKRPHLTHVVPDVDAIDVIEGADGREQVLRVANPGGQALLTLTS